MISTAMNELLRSTLDEAYHGIEPVGDNAGDEIGEVDVAGPVNETGDTFATRRALPRMRPSAEAVR